MTNNNSPHKQYFASNLMSQVVASDIFDTAKAQVRSRRLKQSAHDDIWDLCIHWQCEAPKIRDRLLSGTYQLSPLQCYGCNDQGHAITRWSAQDAIVLKALSIVLSQHLKPYLDQRCHHIKGNGGLKGGIRSVDRQIKSGHYRYIIKTDIRDFYASISHDILLSECNSWIKDPRILDLIKQYMNRVEIRFGNHDLIDIGITKGCPLSPLMGAVMLKSLDKMIPNTCGYARFMDDWVILTKTRRQLRRILKQMHQQVHRLKLRRALSKTYIGRISKGFDFLGYRFNVNGLCGLACKTIDNHKQKLARLYEQGTSDQRVREYIKHWQRWVRSGLTV